MSFPLLAAQVPFLLDMETTASTNSMARELAPLPSYSAVITTNQTAGRGRLGRQWLSEPNNSVALSLVVPFQQSNPEMTPLLMGLAVLRAVRAIGVTQAELKWPNDILVGKQKIAGILCEIVPSGQIIAGVGLNLRFRDKPPTDQATSLAEHIRLEQGIPDRWASACLAELRSLIDAGPHRATSEVQQNLATINRRIEVVDFEGQSWLGRAEDIDAGGRLIVSRSGGEKVALSSGDVRHLYQ